MPTESLPRQLARTRGLSMGAPSAPTVTADGTTVLFLRSGGGDDPVQRLWSLDVATGAERVVAGPETSGEDELSEAEKVRRERMRTRAGGITEYATARGGALAVYALGGALHVTDTASGETRPLATAGEVVDPRPDPDGTHIAYASAGALRVIGADGTGDRVLAEPDGEAVTWGLPEHVAAESMGRFRGFWWSPDGASVLAARVDESGVDRWYIADPADPGRPPREMRYPAVGRDNAVVTLWILGLDGGRVAVDWDREAFEYLATAGWDAHGPLISVQSRDQRTLRVLAVDPATGATTLLREQTDPYWTHLAAGTPARTAAGALVTVEAADDTWRLHVDGEPVTAPGLQVHDVLGVDGETVLFNASTAPVAVHLWTWRPGEGPRRRSVEPGIHTGALSGDTMVHVARTRAAATPAVTVLRGGERVAAIASHAEEPVLRSRMTLHAVGPRRLSAAVFKPSWHEPGRRLPVLMDPYGGPAARKVYAVENAMTLRSQWFAEQGFAVVVVDGAGTPGRGPGWERLIWGDKAGPVLDDQVEALQGLAAEDPDLDLTKVGVRGWSYGGYLAALAVLRRPDVFHAAAAGAGPLDMRLYDTHWRERFLGHPDVYPENYERSTLIGDAPKLERPLLLVHGLTDDNVFAVNSLRLSAALLAAGKYHEVLPLPGSHMTTDPAVAENLMVHESRFFHRALGLE